MRHVFIITLLLFFLPLFSEASVVNRSPAFLQNGLIGYWTFDGNDIGNGVLRNKANSSHDGYFASISTTTFYAAGKIGQGGDFDGVDDAVELPNTSPYNFSGSDNFTISAWIYPKDVAASHTIFSTMDAAGNGGFYFGLNSSGNPQLIVRDSGGNAAAANSSISLTANKWHHVSMVFTGPTSVKFYINGATESFTLSRTLAGVSSPRYIGRNPNVGASYFKGIIDDVRIYNLSLATSSIAMINAMGAGKLNIPPANIVNNGLLGYWTFDGKDVTSNVKDVSGNGNTGYFTSTAATSTRNVKGVIGQATYYSGVDGTGTAIIPTISPGTTFTYAAWIYIPSGSVSFFANLMANGNASGLWILNDKIDFDSGGTHSSNTAISRDTWHHIAVVDDATNVTFYLDGNPDGTATVTNPAFFNGMGCDQGTGSECFRGYHDDVRLYSRALSAQEIKNLYAMGQGKIGVSSVNTNATGLIGYWTFDGKDMPNGVAIDRSGNGNYGSLITIASSTFYVAGKIGQGLNFDGVNDNINLDNCNCDLSTTNRLTFSAWIYPTGSVAASNVFSRGASFSSADDTIFYVALLNTDSTRLRAAVSDGTNQVLAATDAGTITQNQWQYITVVWDGTTLSIFRNGVWLTSSFNSSFTSIWNGGDANDRKTSIGEDARGDSFYWNGKIDDVRLYSSVLATSSIQQLYNMGR